MAAHGLASRGAVSTLVSSEVASRDVARVRRAVRRRVHLWILLLLTCVALLTRIYTTNSLAGEPTSDEYLYGVNARDLSRAWLSGQSIALEDLGVEGRSVVVESAALTLILPWDPITVGRTMQALFNALCVPMTFVVGRQAGLARSASVVAAVLLMGVPEFQELAWRFWTDSQATFVCLVFLSALLAFMRRPSPLSGLLGVVCLGLLLLTKESAAVTFTPFLVLALAVPVGRRLNKFGRIYAAFAAALVVMAFVGFGVLLARAPNDLKHNALLEKTFGAGPLVLSSILNAIPVIPTYPQQLVGLIGPAELGTGFLWASLIGLSWLVAQSAIALWTQRPRWTAWTLGWLAASLVWLPAMVVPWRDLGSLNQTDPWVVLAAGSLLVVVGLIELHLRNSRRGGWGMAFVGLVVVAVLSERLVISVTPKVSNAALTFRSLMPVVPLFALAAGGGLWSAAGALALIVPNAFRARAALAVIAAAVLVVFWSPLVRQRFSTNPLLGRVADRGADPDTPQGLRVQVFYEAQGWFQDNIRPTDVVLTGVGVPRLLGWYADLGVDGMNNLIDLGSQPGWSAEQRRAFALDRSGPRGVDYVIDFNVDWTDPDGDRARQWRETFDELASRPNLETAYLVRDKYGLPVFYVLRNHGFAVVQTDT